MSDLVTIYRASAYGVDELRCEPDGYGGYRQPGTFFVDGTTWIIADQIGKYHFIDRTEAALKAEELRLMKIDSLERQLDELRATGPHITLFPHKE